MKDFHLFIGLQALLPRLEKGGRILNIGSGLAKRGCDGLSAYGMSKAAVFLMHETMKIEFKSKVCARRILLLDTFVSRYLKPHSSAFSDVEVH